ncbi:hypothetical protein AVEN_95243-1 [Araneus ventricosus]|uniref:Uncharacterized protein n=1 Tax=Araneus ventricosus TaxID=182803 RepID=A0A4Y2DHV9_ARAVE|nr:hypothetical protein AVEN_95243-1 [Araneus ventricosus]
MKKNGEGQEKKKKKKEKKGAKERNEKKKEEKEESESIHVESKVGEIKDHVNSCKKIERCPKMKVEEGKGEVEGKIESGRQSTNKIEWKDKRTELKTGTAKPGESLQVMAADVERLMSLAYASALRMSRDSLGPVLCRRYQR